MPPSTRIRKGVILAGGRGTRLLPLTATTNKHLLPVGNRRMIEHALDTLAAAAIGDVLVVSTPEYLPEFQRLLSDRVRYAVQPTPRGIADGLLIAQVFLEGEGCVLVLGDNMFRSSRDILEGILDLHQGATIFSREVDGDLSRYGVVEVDSRGRVVTLEEKPFRPRSNLAVPGLYILDGRAPAFADGRTEIVDVLREYMNDGTLKVVPLSSDVQWLDMGTHDGLSEARRIVA